MKKWLLIFCVFATSAVSAAVPGECDADNFEYEVAGQQIDINHCYFRVAQDGSHFNRNLEAGKRYVGIYDFTNRAWLLEPVHQSITTFQRDKFLTLDHGAKFYRFYDLKTKQYSPSNISRLIGFPYAHGDKHKWSVYELDGDPAHIGLFNFRDGSIYKTLNNVDGVIGDAEKPIQPIYTAQKGGYVVRHVQPDGSKYYMVYSDTAKELTGKIDAARVYPFALSIREGRNAIGSSYVLFERIDAERKLYWPILFDDEVYLKRPDNILGLRFDEKEPSQTKFTVLDEYITQFSDSPYLGYKKAGLPEDMEDRIAFLSDQSRKIVATEMVDLPTPLVTGKHFVANRRIFVFDNRIELPHLKKSFKDRAELQAFLADREKNIETLAADEKRGYDESRQAAAAKRKAEQPPTAQEFIERIHATGPNASSLQAFFYDVGVYCRYGGPRCSSYQAQYRAMENASNQRNELANQQRINNIGAGPAQAPTARSGYSQATTDRYNAAVKSAADKERKRVQDEQWKKR